MASGPSPSCWPSEDWRPGRLRASSGTSSTRTVSRRSGTDRHVRPSSSWSTRSRNGPNQGSSCRPTGPTSSRQYFPYLRLAEAYLLLDAAEDAAEALQVSARLGIEPAEERAALEARVRALIDAKPPPSDPTPTPEPTPTAQPSARGRLAARPPPSRDRSATAGLPVATRIAPAAVAPTRPSELSDAAGGRLPSPTRERSTVPAPETPLATPLPRRDLPALDITSDPPGARVFLDDDAGGTH